MICPNCQTQNREQAKFCDNCGALLNVICPNCGTANRPAAKFCDNCGHNLKSAPAPAGPPSPAAAPQPAATDQFIPPDLVTKLEAARRSRVMEGERRVVTMLFCDVVGSTAASEQLDPEEWTEIMNGAFEQMITPVYHYEGTVARLMGDAILAFFGAPLAHEDDPRRAILAGLDIVQGVQRYRHDVNRSWGIDLNVRVGINTGLVVVGAVGSDLRLEYTAMGDAINLAARMEQTAEPGTVQVAEETYRLVAPLFAFEALGGVAVKGKSEPVQSFRVLGPKASPGRLRGIEGLEAPLIGRQHEFRILQAAINRLQRGAGGIIYLVGEAGLGKSRLFRELKSTVKNGSPAVQWIESLSYSYETEQPYALFQRLIRRLLDLEATDSPQLLREKFRLIADERPADEREGLLQVLESLFGLTREDGQLPLQGEAFRGRLYTAMTQNWRHQAGQGPVVMVLDDLHWADPASASLLQHLFSLIAEVPLLFLCALRPEPAAPGWTIRRSARDEFPDHYTEILLQPLSHEWGGRLVDNLLRVTDLPPELRQRILERSEGNPFFVEEIIRSLIDQGAIVQDQTGGRWRVAGRGQSMDIPNNLLALLVARIDRLTEDARRTLQLASVIGRSFYYRVLAQIVDLAERLEADLLTLQLTDMIREVTREPELEYSFRHALTQEAAYSTLLLKQRRSFHRQVGEVLEALFPGKHDEMAAELAGHFYQARDFKRALRYYTAAGERDFRLHAPTEAIAHFSRAIACAQKVDVSGQQLIHLYLRLGRSFEHGYRFEEALGNYQEMVELASDRGDDSLKLASLTAQCIIRATQTPLYDPALARQLSEQALALAKTLNDQESEAKVLWALLLVEYWAGGDEQRALEYGRRSLAIGRELGLKEQVGYALTNLTMVYFSLEQFNNARQAGREARETWRELGNTPMLADGYNSAMWIEIAAGEYDTAISMGKEGQRLGRSIGNLWGQAGAMNSMAVAYLLLGDVGRTLCCLHEVDQLAVGKDLRPLIYFGLPYLALTYLTVGDYERASRYADQLYDERDALIQIYRRLSLAVSAQVKIQTGQLELAQRILEEASEGWEPGGQLFGTKRLLLAHAYLHLAQGKPRPALMQMERLTGRMRQAGVQQYLPEALWLQGKALLALDEPDLARDAFLEARRVGQETGERRVLWQILDDLSNLEASAGDAAGAERYRQQAVALINYIADHAGNDQLRHAFLSLPQVCSVLAG